MLYANANPSLRESGSVASMLADTSASHACNHNKKRLRAPVRAATQLGLITCLTLFVVASGPAQEVMTLPLDANGKPVLPPGAVTETAYVIDAFAGTGEEGFDGDGGLATLARLHTPRGIAVDALGNVYVADSNNGRVRRIDPSGKITTIAGNGRRRSAGDGAGDGGPATEAQLSIPNDVAVDASGNVYVTDGSGHRVRKVDATGTISTFAGTGAEGSEGDGGPATEAQLNRPNAIAVDADGNVFVGEYSGYRVRKIDATGTITTIAGIGTKGGAGDGGLATSAQFNFISGLAVDGLGNVLVSDMNEARIRKIAPDGRIATIAGTGFGGHAGDGGPAVEAQIATPGGLALDVAGNLFVAEFWVGRLRKIDPAGIITTIAGTGEQRSTGDMGLATDAALDRPRNVAVGSDGRLYVAENYADRIRVLSPTAERSRFWVPLGNSGDSVAVIVEKDGSLKLDRSPLVHGLEVVASNGDRFAFGQTESGEVVATYIPNTQTVELQAGKALTLTAGEDGAWRIGDEVATNGYRHVEDGREYLLEWTGAQWRLAKYTIRTVAGTLDVAEGVPATDARLFNPHAVALDSAGNAYVTEASNNRVRKIDPSGIITTIAGTGEQGYAGDGGPATQAEFDSPRGIGVNWLGEIFVADFGNDVVRKIDVLGRISTINTSGPLFNPDGLALDLFGNIVVAESHVRNHLVRRIDSRGNVTTIAGLSGQRGGFEGDGWAAKARLYYPRAVAADAAGNVYVADSFNQRVRKIDPTGTIRTIAGTGERGYSGDGGPATDAQLAGPNGLLVDAAGNVYVLDSNQVRRIDPNGMIAAIAGTGEYGHSGDGGPAIAAELRNPSELALDAAGNLYLAERFGYRVRKIDAAGTITTIAGTGERGFSGDGGAATEAQLGTLGSVAADSLGNLYIADSYNHRVRKIDTSGVITTYVGTGVRDRSSEFGYVVSTGEGPSDYRWEPSGIAPAAETRLSSPNELAVDANDILYVFDSGNRSSINARVGKIDTASPEPLITPLPPMDVPRFVTGFDVDDSGNVFVFSRGAVLMFDSDGSGTTVAGGGETRFMGDGEPAGGVFMGRFANIALDPHGNIWVADSSSRRVHVLESVP